MRVSVLRKKFLIKDGIYINSECDTSSLAQTLPEKNI